MRAINWMTGLAKGAWGFIPGAVKKTLGFGALGAGTLAVGDGVLTGGENVGGLLRGGGKSVGNVGADIAASTGVAEKKYGFYQIVQFFAEILKGLGVGGGIPEAMMKFADRGAATTRDRNSADGVWAAGNGGPGPNAGGNDGPNAGGPGSPDYNTNGNNGFGWGTAALATAGAGGALWGASKILKGRAVAPGIEVAANGADDAIKVMQAGQLGDDVARGASRFGGRWGKIAGGILGLGAVGYMLSPSEAEAATLPTAGSTRTGLTASAGTGSVFGMPEVGGLGLSIVGGKAAAETIAHSAAPVAAKLGLSTVARAIPGVSAIYAAGETVYNVGSDLLRGDFKKAGLNLVSGVGETVAGLGGGLTYFTLGAAWRESVRGVGIAALGEENAIDHSITYEGANMLADAGSWLKKQFFGAANGETAPAAPQQVLTQRNNGPVLAF